MKVGVLGAVSAGVALALSAANAQVAVSLDGVESPGEWPAVGLVYPPPSKLYASSSEDALVMRYDAVAKVYSFLLRPRTGSYMYDSSLFVDVDRNSSTGFDRSKSSVYAPPGFDVLVRPVLLWWPQGSLSSVELYRACHYLDAGCASVLSLPASQFNASADAVEFSVSKAQLELAAGRAVASGTGDVDVAVALQSVTRTTGVATVTSEPYTFQGYLSFFGDLASLGPCAGAAAGEQRAAVVYSTTARDAFFQDKAYSQLFGAMQYQLFQAGLAHARVSLAQLADYAAMCKYRVVVIAYEAAVKEADFAALVKSLFILRHRYGVGLVTSGNFLTNLDVPRAFVDPYFYQGQLLGVLPALPVYAKTTSTVVTVADAAHPIAKGVLAGAVLFTSAELGNYTAMFLPHSVASGASGYASRVVATQTLSIVDPAASAGAGKIFAAIIASEGAAALNGLGFAPGRAVHFGSLEMLANGNLVWRAAQWAASGAQPALALSVSRQAGLTTIRNDCDQSMYAGEGVVVEADWADNIAPTWLADYGAVVSYYINIGANVKQGEWTNWTLMAPIYAKLAENENELGSHSYTHPDNINLLSNAQLDYQFGASQAQIKANLSLPGRVAAAQPGATEDLRVALYLGNKFFKDSYFSGGYSGVGAGYPGVFGFLTNAAADAMYVAPNVWFDFTMIEFLKMTPAAATQTWLDQLKRNTALASTPIQHWPIHDYGPRNWGVSSNGDTLPNTGPGYTMAMFTTFLKAVKDAGHEFATTMDLTDRLKAFLDASLSVLPGTSGTLAVAARQGPKALSLGKLALAVVQPGTSLKIVAMNNWYAYSADKVFLAAAGIPAAAAATVTLGAGAQLAAVTRLSAMPMRAELLKLSGDGTGLAFTATGKGAFRVTLSNAKPFADYTFLLPAGVEATKVSDTAVDFTTASAVTVYSVVVS